MAQAFFDHLSEFTSTSTDTMVADFEGQTVAERGQVAPSVVMVLELMNEEDWTFHRNKGTNSRQNWLMPRTK